MLSHTVINNGTAEEITCTPQMFTDRILNVNFNCVVPEMSLLCYKLYADYQPFSTRGFYFNTTSPERVFRVLHTVAYS